MTARIRRGVLESHRMAAAALYWDAFHGKLGPVLNPPPRGRAFLDRVLDPVFAISAVSPEGRLLGLCGFKTLRGAFVAGSFADLRKVYGFLGALWRAPLLAVLDRKAVPNQLLMDGICVADDARGQGVGTALIAEIMDVAQDLRMKEVRLDVIDTNPRAMRLYRRLGFEVADWHDLGPLGGAFGFRRAATMVRRVSGRGGRVSRISPSPGRAA